MPAQSTPWPATVSSGLTATAMTLVWGSAPGAGVQVAPPSSLRHSPDVNVPQ
ncbi:MAG: hypothetical protein H6644_09625 [Caldilineaceae bacterium]|nr:hypothetical protein [Caldilineaceae bacterium]